MSALPRLELKIPPSDTPGNSSEKDVPETPSPTAGTISSTCSSPSSEDGLLASFNESSHPTLSTPHLLIIHIGFVNFLTRILSFAYSTHPSQVPLWLYFWPPRILYFFLFFSSPISDDLTKVCRPSFQRVYPLFQTTLEQQQINTHGLVSPIC